MPRRAPKKHRDYQTVTTRPIEGPAFNYLDHDTGQLSTILGYPTHQLK
jgi:hypothetical protein